MATIQNIDLDIAQNICVCVLQTTSTQLPKYLTISSMPKINILIKRRHTRYLSPRRGPPPPLPAASLIFLRVSASLSWAWIWARSSCIFRQLSAYCRLQYRGIEVSTTRIFCIYLTSSMMVVVKARPTRM